MLSKKEIKDIQSLSHKKFRDELGWFIAEGPKIVTELMQKNSGQVEKIFALPAWADEHPAFSNSVTVVSEQELQKISQLQTPNQVVGVFKKFPQQAPRSGIFSVYLDAIQDPGNFGTILRTCDWFGIKQVICGEGCADLYNPKVVQSTMASIGRVAVYYDREAGWLKTQTGHKYAAVLDGTSLEQVEKTKAGVLIIGNESRGISDAILKCADKKITIPRRGEAESLNAAVATGIILSHLLS